MLKDVLVLYEFEVEFDKLVDCIESVEFALVDMLELWKIVEELTELVVGHGGLV